MDSTMFIIGIIGNIISVLVFVSPIPTFWRIVRTKSTEEFEPAPYVLTLLNSLLWLYYGVTKPDGLLIATVNGFGTVMETIYVVLFLVYAADHAARVKTAKLVATLDIGFFGFVFATTRFAIAGLDMKIMVIGLICVCLNVFMYGSPLTAVRTVIATRSVEYMPFFLSFFLFLNGGVWATYAILDRDIFLGVPNGIGFFLGIIQLGIYAFYKNSRVNSQGSDEAPEEGWQASSVSLLASHASGHGGNTVSIDV
ncbi:bidirectional sugar transporter SWEET16-like [Lolium rigidum]|uniref:bidirectional sugar transporter SWEET16-like n=1 Tax=Lolium rigidum TaxID=89674 RepID=UPI001F5D6354|nr:bidirectional sugar transporter SWEET16-like [Lolium rigidum]